MPGEPVAADPDPGESEAMSSPSLPPTPPRPRPRLHPLGSWVSIARSCRTLPQRQRQAAALSNRGALLTDRHPLERCPTNRDRFRAFRSLMAKATGAGGGRRGTAEPAQKWPHEGLATPPPRQAENSTS